MSNGAGTLELVAVESDGVELVSLGTEADRLAWMEWISDANETAVDEGGDATDYRIVAADTRGCPRGRHSSSHHATVCLAEEWAWENLGQ